jgi:uncharacterized protein YprB with RNaseH-like and TPR domain
MLYLDIETAPIPGSYDSDAYADAGREPPAHYRSEEAIERWREKDRAAWADTLGLSPRTGRVVAVGLSRGDGVVLTQSHTHDHPDDEARIVDWTLHAIADEMQGVGGKVVTFNGMSFDLHFLAIRAVALGLTLPPHWSDLFRRYTVQYHIDLYQVLTNWGGSRSKGDTLTGWCRAFGIEVTEHGSGADVAGWVADAKWDKVQRHVTEDVRQTVALHGLCKRSGLCP